MRMHKGAAMVLALLLLLTAIAGCAAPAQGPDASLEGAKGRYMETDVNLPALENADSPSVIGMWLEGEDRVYITFAVHAAGEEDYTYKFTRCTLHPDGSVDTAPEAWLSEGAALGGNEMRVLKGADGNLYAAFGDYTEDMKLRCNLLRSRDNGQTYEAVTGPAIDALGMITSLSVLADGRILAAGFDADRLMLLDAGGGLLEEIEFYQSQSETAALGNKIAYVAPGGESVRVRDLDSGTEADYPYPYGKAPSFDDQNWSALALAFAPDGSLYLATPEGLHRHAPEGTLWETLVDGEASSLGLPSFSPTQLLITDESPAQIYLSGSDSGMGQRLLAYVFDPEAAQAASVELNVFSLEEDDTVRQAVVAFNRARSDVKVTYTAPMAGAAAGSREDYIKALNTELLAGKGPDILLLDGLPVDSYVEKGVLMDIAPILDGAEPILENIRKAYETEGKVYALPLRVGFHAVLGQGAALNAFSSLESLAAYAQTAAKPVLGAGAFNYELFAEFLLNTYGTALYSGDPADITAFLSQAKALSGDIGVTAEAGEGWNTKALVPTAEIMAMLRADSAVPQMSLYMQGLAETVYMEMNSLTGAVSMLGLELVRQGKADVALADKRIQPIGLTGVNQATKHPEAAADFLQTLLSEPVQGASLYQLGFPVNQAALEGYLANADTGTSVGMNMDGLEEIVGTWPEQAQREQVRSMLLALDAPERADPVLTQMLLPAVTACLSGETTVEDAATKLQSLLATYLSE